MNTNFCNVVKDEENIFVNSISTNDNIANLDTVANTYQINNSMLAETYTTKLKNTLSLNDNDFILFNDDGENGEFKITAKQLRTCLKVLIKIAKEEYPEDFL
jgi:hypothetical protein